jgi:hypothetical protein
MVRGSKVSSKRKKAISTKKLALISIFIALTIIFAALVASYFSSKENDVFSLKAAIIDQLARNYPNPLFIGNVTKLLGDAGFSVECYFNETVNVEFFRSLAERRFGIIILRFHSALRQGGSPVDLFTSEKWDGNKYSQEWIEDLIVPGNYSDDPNYYCAITYKFIESLSGRFPKSIIFAMGCWSLKQGCEQLAKAFIAKGAKAYIGWTDEILPRDTDNEMLILLENLIKKDYPLGYAVRNTNSYHYIGVLPNGTQVPITSKLRLYPDSEEVSSLKLSELINEAKTMSTQYTVSVCQSKILNLRRQHINKIHLRRYPLHF